jgi:predicted short-subunit dehydrogenase-like oxidoreductase (DUF2520 family)
MKIGFIGAGKVGVSLGKYFKDGGLKIVGYYSRNKSSASIAAEFIGVDSMEIEELVNLSDVVFITVNDDQISKVWEFIKKLNIEGKVFLHTSGSLTSDAIYAPGVYSYSLHPMFPFSDKFTTYKSLGSAVFSLEGSRERVDELKAMIESLGNKVFQIEKDKKPLYHLSNVMVSNLVLSLIEKGVSYLEGCGVDRDVAKEALLPLIKLNIDNISKKSFEDSLTGPIERGDIGTVEKHLKIIPDADIPLYKALSLNLVEMAERKNGKERYYELDEYLRRQQ